MDIKIGNTALKLHKAEKNTYPKGVRSVVAAVTVNGAPTEYQLTTGIGRDGEFRRYIHVRVESVHFWAKITPAVEFILLPAVTAKPVLVVTEPVAETAES